MFVRLDFNLSEISGFRMNTMLAEGKVIYFLVLIFRYDDHTTREASSGSRKTSM